MPGAGQFTPGPILHFVAPRGASIASFLGTAVLAPDQEIEYAKIPVLNDLGGRSVPFQNIKDGQEGVIITTLNRFDLALCRSLQLLATGTPGAPLNVANLGSEGGTSRGTLEIGVTDFTLIMANAYAGTASAGANAADLNTARAWASCSIMKYKEDTKGTRVLEVALAIKCNNMFNPITRGFTLYTQNGPFPLGPVS